MARRKKYRKKYGIVMEVNLPNASETFQKLGVDRDGKVQKYVTQEVFKRLQPYIPKRSGLLRSKAEIISNTKIAVRGVYARAQFFGVTKSGKPFNYSPLGGAKAGSHWDRRLVADEGKTIIAETNRFVRRNRK